MRSSCGSTCPPSASGTVAGRARLNWLACTDKVCVPEQGEVSLELPVGGAARATRGSTSGAAPCRVRSPARPFALKRDRVEIALALPASLTLGEPYFFPAEDGRGRLCRAAVAFAATAIR